MSAARSFLAKNKKATIVFKAVLNNTAFDGHGLEDWSGGDTATGLLNRSVEINNNAEVLISNDRVIGGGQVRDAMLNGIQLEKSIGAPFSTENIFEIGKVRFGFRNEEASTFDLHFRDFQGSSFEVVVGGIENRDRFNESAMSLDEYLFLISGKIPDHKYNHDEIFVPLNTIPIELENQFPPNTYAGTGGIEGDEENARNTKPFTIGSPQNITPEDLGDGLYQWHDGSGVSVTTAYDKGQSLTLEAGDPLAAKPAEGKYRADSNGFVRVGDAVESLTLDVVGVAGPADESLALILDIATKSRYSMSDLGGDWDIGYYFTEQRPVIEYIRDIAWSLDYYILHGDDGNLSLNKRYNGNNEDFLGNPNIVDSFSIVEDDIDDSSIEFLGTSDRYSKYKIGYDKNWTKANKSDLHQSTRRKFSREFLFVEGKSTIPLEDGIKEETKTRETNLINKADAELMSTLIYRDSRKRKKFEFELSGHQWLLLPGMVGTIDHSLIGSGLFELSSVSEDTESLTTIILGYLV